MAPSTEEKVVEFSQTDLPELLAQYYKRLFPYTEFYNWLSYGNGNIADLTCMPLLQCFLLGRLLFLNLFSNIAYEKRRRESLQNALQAQNAIQFLYNFFCALVYEGQPYGRKN